jgi:hypothetical protein
MRKDGAVEEMSTPTGDARDRALTVRRVDRTKEPNNRPHWEEAR